MNISMAQAAHRTPNNGSIVGNRFSRQTTTEGAHANLIGQDQGMETLGETIRYKIERC